MGVTFALLYHERRRDHRIRVDRCVRSQRGATGRRRRRSATRCESDPSREEVGKRSDARRSRPGAEPRLSCCQLRRSREIIAGCERIERPPAVLGEEFVIAGRANLGAVAQLEAVHGRTPLSNQRVTRACTVPGPRDPERGTFVVLQRVNRARRPVAASKTRVSPVTQMPYVSCRIGSRRLST